MQNVFDQRVYYPKHYVISEKVYTRMVNAGYSGGKLATLQGVRFNSGDEFIKAVKKRLGNLTSTQEQQLLGMAQQVKIYINPERIDNLDPAYMTQEQIDQVKALSGKTFYYRWELQEALAAMGKDWRYLPETKLNKQQNKLVAQNLQIVENACLVREKTKRRRGFPED